MNRNHLITASLFLIAMAAMVSAETVTVITRENTVREDCRFLAPAKAKVQFGDQLDVIAVEGDWFRVKFRNVNLPNEREGTQAKAHDGHKQGGASHGILTP